MLTEKEEAIKITERYKLLLDIKEKYIEASLTCVDEIIKEVQSNRDYMYKSFCCNMSLRILENQVKYWERVKIEIKKL